MDEFLPKNVRVKQEDMKYKQIDFGNDLCLTVGPMLIMLLLFLPTADIRMVGHWDFFTSFNIGHPWRIFGSCDLWALWGICVHIVTVEQSGSLNT